MSRSSRYEHKFLVPNPLARTFARELRPYMQLDPWLARHGAETYLVSSVYLDSPALGCFEAVEQGARNRFKLRMRWYGHDLAAPVFLEEKCRVSDAITKIRVGVSMEDAREILAGRPFSGGWMGRLRPEERAVGTELLARMRAIGAVPSCIVRYRRAAWEAPAYKGLRVTFDHALTGSPTGNSRGLTLPTSLPDGHTILEVKFRDRMPEWLSAVMRRHQLVRCSVPKYALCVHALRSDGVSLPSLPRGNVA